MAFGSEITKSNKKKSPTTSELKKENAALKNKVATLEAKLAASELKNAKAASTESTEEKYNQLRSALQRVCATHPGVKQKIRATGCLHLIRD